MKFKLYEDVTLTSPSDVNKDIIFGIGYIIGAKGKHPRYMLYNHFESNANIKDVNPAKEEDIRKLTLEERKSLEASLESNFKVGDFITYLSRNDYYNLSFYGVIIDIVDNGKKAKVELFTKDHKPYTIEYLKISSIRKLAPGELVRLMVEKSETINDCDTVRLIVDYTDTEGRHYPRGTTGGVIDKIDIDGLLAVYDIELCDEYGRMIDSFYVDSLEIVFVH